MRRRRFLTLGGAGLTGALAGCSAPTLGSDGGDDRHPLAGATAHVRIDNESRTDHDVAANAREALAFWEAESEQYTGFEIEFDIVNGDADIVIEYVDDPGRCQAVENYSENVLGCAPLVRPHNRLPQPATAVVVAAARPFGKIRITTKHEIGHILGLDHDDAPLEIMSNRPEDRIPLYDVRIDIWETVNDGQRRASEASSRFHTGTEAWNDESYGAAEWSFRAANDHYREAAARFRRARERADEFEGHPRVETVALEDLRADLDRLLGRMDSADGFSARMAEAAAAAGAGDGQAANESLREANGHIRAFHDIGSPELRDIAIALGLVRGFQRDEEIADVEEEQIEP